MITQVHARSLAEPIYGAQPLFLSHARARFSRNENSLSFSRSAYFLFLYLDTKTTLPRFFLFSLIVYRRSARGCARCVRFPTLSPLEEEEEEEEENRIGDDIKYTAKHEVLAGVLWLLKKYIELFEPRDISFFLGQRGKFFILHIENTRSKMFSFLRRREWRLFKDERKRVRERASANGRDFIASCWRWW